MFFWNSLAFSSQQEFAVWLRKLKQGLCINLEEWDGEGDGREFQKGYMYTYGWFMLRLGRKQRNSVKQLFFNKKQIKKKKKNTWDRPGSENIMERFNAPTIVVTQQSSAGVQIWTN